MTWRYFLALVYNLSPYGAVASRLHANDKNDIDDEVDEQTDRQRAAAFFSSVVSV